GQVFPSSPAQAGYLQRHLRVKLRLQPPPTVLWGPEGAQGWRARVLYITRLGAELRQRRTFVPESHEALLRLMEEMNMELTEEDLSDLRVILGTAREVVAAGQGGMGGVVGPEELPGWAERRFGERCVARDAGLFCRNDFVRIVGGTGDFTCVFSRDCEGQEQPQ
ncbi:unnamed protein product, partial [Closterium sp. NIES-53]